MKISLEVHGREMTFSEAELTAILESHFDTNVAKTAKREVPQRPTEGEYFKVDPTAIDQTLFTEKRKDEKQEKTRQLILDAFAEVKKNLNRYGKPFITFIPKKTWHSKTGRELKELAEDIGDHMADWVEQALEWAQRISNGEAWEAICNDLDILEWYRAIIWKSGCCIFVGGARKGYFKAPASNLPDFTYGWNQKLPTAVPLVVLYK